MCMQLCASACFSLCTRACDLPIVAMLPVCRAGRYACSERNAEVLEICLSALIGELP